ncbi:DNA glycosylase [Auriscalpium vulgare]|uniref:DNA glycosylase n=1 Tax=Auriscalpium vulgare TaxID=40419 RepID=A0ACB8S7X3_9AGAM|nr:DNA glycosylase [Auriscalpium vulgare]
MLSDYLAEDLDVMFCGINPGYTSAEIGHHYANPVNHFWKCLHRSGLTPSLVPPSEDFTLPEKFNLGMTNLVDRPSAEAAELSAADRISAVPALLAKIARYRPRIVCFVGKGIWLDVERVLKTTSVASVTDYAPSTPERSTVTASPGKRSRKASAPEFSRRHQSIVAETLFFVVPSTSGRVVSHQLNDKIVLFTALKHLLDRLKDGEVDTSHMAVVCLPGS